jgi:histidinol phosphatase-like PHP family hydrolase
VVEAAIDGGIELLGICDHNYGVGLGRHDLFLSKAEDFSDNYGRNLRKYYDHIDLIREKYADRIRILRGIEIATVGEGRYALPEGADVSFFDYCLIEHVDSSSSVTKGDLFGYAERFKCPVGVAHTDLFAHAERLGIPAENYFCRMAEKNIFWEMNVNFDSTHKYREHAYMLRFFEDEKQQDIIRKAGVRISIGFDGHRCNEYKSDRVKAYCKKIEQMGIKMAFEN